MKPQLLFDYLIENKKISFVVTCNVNSDMPFNVIINGFDASCEGNIESLQDVAGVCTSLFKYAMWHYWNEKNIEGDDYELYADVALFAYRLPYNTIVYEQLLEYAREYNSVRITLDT